MIAEAKFIRRLGPALIESIIEHLRPPVLILEYGILDHEAFEVDVLLSVLLSSFLSLLSGHQADIGIFYGLEGVVQEILVMEWR